MMPRVHVIPVLEDNYAYLIETAQGFTVIDPGEAAPVDAFLAGRTLSAIILTHHHGDHIGGAPALKAAHNARIFAPASEAHRIPGIDVTVQDGEEIKINGLSLHAIATPGHTAGHMCFYAADPGWLFSADTLFSLGCGRIFEGTAEQMWDSLQKIAALPDDTLIYCGHEYTLSNGVFAMAVEPHNADLQDRMAAVEVLRAAGKPTIPVRLGMEKATNPFLRAGSASRFKALRLAKDKA